MPSSTKGSRGVAAFEKWNRKVHYYLGLYFLLFLWLFSLTGLLLNHGQWPIAIRANQRSEARYERDIQPPGGSAIDAQVRDVVRQLGLRGEIDITPVQQAGTLAFTVNRPSDSSQ